MEYYFHLTNEGIQRLKISSLLKVTQPSQNSNPCLLFLVNNSWSKLCLLYGIWQRTLKRKQNVLGVVRNKFTCKRWRHLSKFRQTLKTNIMVKIKHHQEEGRQDTNSSEQGSTKVWQNPKPLFLKVCSLHSPEPFGNRSGLCKVLVQWKILPLGKLVTCHLTLIFLFSPNFLLSSKIL